MNPFTIHPITWFLIFILLHLSIEIICSLTRLIRYYKDYWKSWRVVRKYIRDGVDIFSDFWYQFIYQMWMLCLCVTMIPFTEAYYISISYNDSVDFTASKFFETKLWDKIVD